MPTNNIITQEQLTELINKYEDINDELCDVTHLVNKAKTKNALGITDKIKQVLVFAETHTEFKNELNNKIIYKKRFICSVNHPNWKIVRIGEQAIPVANNPVGDGFIVI